VIGNFSLIGSIDLNPDISASKNEYIIVTWKIETDWRIYPLTRIHLMCLLHVINLEIYYVWE